MDNKEIAVLAGQGRGSGSGMTNDVKQAFLNAFEHVGWEDGDGSDQIEALRAALYPPVGLESISAVFEPGQTVIYDTDALDDLRPMLTVTAHYSDQTSETITAYLLSGTLAEGTSEITVSYGGKTTTFNVTVEHDPSALPTEYQRVEWIEAENGPAIDTNNTLTDNSEIRARMQVMGAGTNTYSGLFGRITPSVILMYSMYQGQAVLGANFARAQATQDVARLSLDTAYDISLNKDTINVDGEVAATFTGDPQSIVEQRNLLIFGWNNNSSPYGPTRQSWARCYGLQVYENGSLVVNLVPCYRKADGEIGMYDLVAQAFRTNAGTGTFTKGDDV